MVVPVAAPWLNAPASYADIEHVAVGITRVSSEQMHAGLLYRSPVDDRIHLLHFCWHRYGRDEIADPQHHEYFWVAPPIRRSVARNLAVFCQDVARQQSFKTIPFAFRIDNSAVFDTDGRLVAASGQGLTCATFVMTMFASMGPGNRLVASETWPQRVCDDAWFQRIIAAMRARDPAHAQELERQRDAARFRPEEIVGAASVPLRPVEFLNALQSGREVLKRMNMLALACRLDQQPALRPLRPRALPTPAEP